MRAEGGYREIDSREALWMLENLDRRRSMEVRSFVSEARLGNFALNRMDDHEMLKLVRDAIRDGRVIAVQKGAAKSDSPSATAELRRLVAQLERATRGKLSYRGRQYKLVVDVDLAKMPGRDYYEVASQAEAHVVLDGAAKELGAPAELLKQASEKISKDWRWPSSHPEGLVLLRPLVVLASSPRDEGPALTPSQIQQMRAPKEDVDPLMSGAGTDLDTSDVELPVASEEEPPPDTSADIEDSETSPADSADSAELGAPDSSAKTSEASDSGDGESNDGSEGNDGGADETDADTAAEDSKDNGDGGESGGGSSPEFW